MQFKTTKSGTYLVRATYDPATQKSPAKVIGKVGVWSGLDLNEGVTLTDAEQAQVDAFLAPKQAKRDAAPLHALTGALNGFLVALEGHPEVETAVMAADHLVLLQGLQKALRKHVRKLAKKAPEPAPTPLPFAAVPVTQEGRTVLPLPLVGSEPK